MMNYSNILDYSCSKLRAATYADGHGRSKTLAIKLQVSPSTASQRQSPKVCTLLCMRKLLIQLDFDYVSIIVRH